MCIRDRIHVETQGTIGVEDNKPEAILELKRVVKEKGREDRIEVMEIPTKYPAGRCV